MKFKDMGEMPKEKSGGLEAVPSPAPEKPAEPRFPRLSLSFKKLPSIAKDEKGTERILTMKLCCMGRDVHETEYSDTHEIMYDVVGVAVRSTDVKDMTNKELGEKITDVYASTKDDEEG